MSVAKAYFVEQVWLPFSELLLEWDQAFHELMLADGIRMAAYERAIKEVVRPGDIVLDLGTGTGILSQWALEAGASRVYGIDLNAPILAEAVARLERRGFASRFVPINELSFAVELPERVDVLLSEIMGNMADNEDFQTILWDASVRFLKPGGIMLPRAVSSFIVPVAAEVAHHYVGTGNIATLNPGYSIDRLCREKGTGNLFNLYYDAIIPQQAYLSAPQSIRTYQEGFDQPSQYRVSRSFQIERDGMFTGFKAYFVAQLSDRVQLDISGDDIEREQTSDSWKHAFLPIEHPISLRSGDELKLDFSRLYPVSKSAFRQVYQWEGSVERNGRVVGHFQQSMHDESGSGSQSGICE